VSWATIEEDGCSAHTCQCPLPQVHQGHSSFSSLCTCEVFGRDFVDNDLAPRSMHYFPGRFDFEYCADTVYLAVSPTTTNHGETGQFHAHVYSTYRIFRFQRPNHRFACACIACVSRLAAVTPSTLDLQLETISTLRQHPYHAGLPLKTNAQYNVCR
jgi:hypothetical protein